MSPIIRRRIKPKITRRRILQRPSRRNIITLNRLIHQKPPKLLQPRPFHMTTRSLIRPSITPTNSTSTITRPLIHRLINSRPLKHPHTIRIIHPRRNRTLQLRKSLRNVKNRSRIMTTRQMKPRTTLRRPRRNQRKDRINRSTPSSTHQMRRQTTRQARPRHFTTMTPSIRHSRMNNNKRIIRRNPNNPPKHHSPQLRPSNHHSNMPLLGHRLSTMAHLIKQPVITKRPNKHSRQLKHRRSTILGIFPTSLPPAKPPQPKQPQVPRNRLRPLPQHRKDHQHSHRPPITLPGTNTLLIIRPRPIRIRTSRIRACHHRELLRIRKHSNSSKHLTIRPIHNRLMTRLRPMLRSTRTQITTLQHMVVSHRRTLT